MAGDPNNITLDQISCRLIEDNFLLTALELHLELIEAGREQTRLKEFFSNPANFERQSAPQNATSIARSQSQATLDSLDISRFSEDGADERVAVLEFELRRSKEIISGLRSTLTQMTAEREEHVTSDTTDLVNNESAKPHELRALNFLVNEYLLRQGYKLTAVTFSEENNEQDFDDWDDVGLNIPRPPELPQLYRVTHKETSEVECQTDEAFCSEEELTRLKNQINYAENQLEDERARFRLETLELSRKAQVDVHEVSTNTDDFNFEVLVQTKTDSSPSPPSPPQLKPENEEPDEIRVLPAKFKESLHQLLDLPKSSHLPEPPNLISLLVETMPSVTASKKEDSIPLISAAAASATTPEQASTLISLLLNLRKKPQEDERKAITDGVRQLMGLGDLLEAHILPQAWELAGQKSAERRLLAADVCLAVASAAPGRLRQAMILPMLQQLLLEAAEPEVKIGAVRALALVVANTAQGDKYLQCEELCFLALEDQEFSVRQLAQQILLPVLAQWSLQIDRFESYLVKRMVSRLKSLALDPRCGSMAEAMGHLIPFILVHLASHVSVLERIEPMAENKLPHSGQKLSNPDYFLDREDCTASELLDALKSRLDDDSYQDWPQMSWILGTFIPGLFEALSAVEVANESAVLAYVKLYHQLCKSMGQHFTLNRIKPMFKEGLRQAEDSIANLEDSSSSQNLPSLVIIPVLLVAILTTGDPNDTMELSNTLRHLLILLPSLKLPSTPLKVSIYHLCRAAALQDTVLACLNEASKNSRPAVRLTSAQLILHCLSCIHDGALTKYVLPQLAMQATDLNEEVKEKVVAIYAELAAEQGVGQAPSRAALQGLMKEAMSSHVMSVAVTRALARILPPSDQAFAEDVVLPQLCQLAAFCLHGISSQTRRMDLGQALVAALSIALQVPLSRQAIAATLVPALRDLSVVCEQCMQAHYDAVSNWLREAESRAQVDSAQPTTPKSEKPHLVQSAMSSATAAGRRSVEDVKQKMSSLLRKK